MATASLLKRLDSPFGLAQEGPDIVGNGCRVGRQFDFEKRHTDILMVGARYSAPLAPTVGVTDSLHHRAGRGEVAVEDREPAFLRVGVVARTDHISPVEAVVPARSGRPFVHFFAFRLDHGPSRHARERGARDARRSSHRSA